MPCLRTLLLALLALLALSSATGECFGPCFSDSFYQIRSDRKRIEIECSRSYEPRQSQLGCITDMKRTWTLASASVNEFADMERAYEDDGRQGAETACEKVCAATNSCRAFGVSSDAHVSEGAWQCIVYYTCLQTQFNEHLDLYKRLQPYECLIKATTFDGVFVNFIESNGVVSQSSRLLSMPTKDFLDMHVKVNEQFNETFNGYRPYKKPKTPFCEQYDSDCVILHAGGYSAAIVSLFCTIVAFNSCVLYVSLTKPNGTDVQPRPRRLRDRAAETTAFGRQEGAQSLSRRSNKINF